MQLAMHVSCHPRGMDPGTWSLFGPDSLGGPIRYVNYISSRNEIAKVTSRSTKEGPEPCFAE